MEGAINFLINGRKNNMIFMRNNIDNDMNKTVKIILKQNKS
jgi:hypothetical protein